MVYLFVKLEIYLTVYYRWRHNDECKTECFYVYRYIVVGAITYSGINSAPHNLFSLNTFSIQLEIHEVVVSCVLAEKIETALIIVVLSLLYYQPPHVPLPSTYRIDL